MTPALSPFFFYQVAFPQPNGYVKYSHATVSLARKLLFLLLDKFPSEIRNWLLNTWLYLLPAEKYCKLVRDEDGINVLIRLTRNQRTSARAKELARMTLDKCNMQNT